MSLKKKRFIGYAVTELQRKTIHKNNTELYSTKMLTLANMISSGAKKKICLKTSNVQ